MSQKVEETKIPNGSYLVCVVKKFSWKEVFFVLLSNILFFDGWESVSKKWILIFNSEGILHVCEMPFDGVPQCWLDHYCNNLTSKTPAELKEIYFNVAPELLTKKDKHLLSLKCRESRLISQS